jgi:hypothetical protein
MAVPDAARDLNGLLLAVQEAHAAACGHRDRRYAHELRIGWGLESGPWAAGADPCDLWWSVECPDGGDTRAFGPTLSDALLAFLQRYGKAAI